MPEAKRSRRTALLGEGLTVPEGSEILGPDGVPVVLVGGVYIFDRPGVHAVNGVDYAVKG